MIGNWTMIGIGVVHLIISAGELFVPKKFLNKARDVSEENKMAYIKGMCKFDCLFGVWCILCGFAMQQIALSLQWEILTFVIPAMIIAIWCNQWGKKYKKEEEAALLPEQKEN